MKFRRRPFRRRPIRNFAPRGSPARRALRELNQAHQLMQSGGYEEANQIFIRLAISARRRKLPQAPFLMAQAGRANLLLDNEHEAVEEIKEALSWLREDNRWKAFYKLGSRAADELEASGHSEQAMEFRTFIESEMQKNDIDFIERMSNKQLMSFPEKCPYCGGNLELEYSQNADSGYLLCSYCGSRVNQV